MGYSPNINLHRSFNRRKPWNITNNFCVSWTKYIAPIVGFIEINIWLCAIGQIMQNLNNIICSLAYAGVFAMGSFFGMLIEEKLSISMVMVRIICKHDATKLIKSLTGVEYAVTTHDV